MLETDYRSYAGGEEKMCTVKVDGAIREGFVRAWSMRPEADPPGWWANVFYTNVEGLNQPGWFHESAVNEVPEP